MLLTQKCLNVPLIIFSQNSCRVWLYEVFSKAETSLMVVTIKSGKNKTSCHFSSMRVVHVCLVLYVRMCPVAPVQRECCDFTIQLFCARIIYFSFGENGLNLLFLTELPAAFPQRFFQTAYSPLENASLYLHKVLSTFLKYPQYISTIYVIWHLSLHLLLLLLLLLPFNMADYDAD